MVIPHDYEARVYAGVLGKLIGVYLGRPFEGWTYDRIMAELGEVSYYVHERLGRPLIVTDDDISGTFTFLRALPDYANRRDVTPQQIGQTWLNYIIERKTILWWGGMGNSTEHTAFLRLKAGVPAPQSGSIALNGQVVAEQIGSQIFIDGWAMVAPGDPELAADLARRAASVSHDGAAIHGAQVLAAMEAQAFVEQDIKTLLDVGLSFIPRDALIARMIGDIREWRERYSDWRTTREQIDRHYGYHIYGGNCHMVPNHALIILGLLYGDDNFQKSLMITNTAGWDTDCNSGNVGCLLGIKNGLAGIDHGPDWRGSVADRMYLSTADGGRAITDAVTETYHVVNIGRALAGSEPVTPKEGARFHFGLPGAVQGFQPDQSDEAPAILTIENVAGHSRDGTRSLALHYADLGAGQAGRVRTPTFIPPEAITFAGYDLIACPTLYPGQTLRAEVEADAGNDGPIGCRLYLHVYGGGDALVVLDGPATVLDPGARYAFAWKIPDTGGQPIAAIGVELGTGVAEQMRLRGTVYLDYMTWDGPPDVRFIRPAEGGTMWRRAWVAGVDHYDGLWPEPYRLIQDTGTGLLIQGTWEWTDYTVTAAIRPHMARRAGIAVHVQGLQRYYALLLCKDGQARLVKVLDGERVLVQQPYSFELDRTYQLALNVQGDRLIGSIDGVQLFDLEDRQQPLLSGAIALVVDEGRLDVDSVEVAP